MDRSNAFQFTDEDREYLSRLPNILADIFRNESQRTRAEQTRTQPGCGCFGHTAGSSHSPSLTMNISGVFKITIIHNQKMAARDDHIQNDYFSTLHNDMEHGNDSATQAGTEQGADDNSAGEEFEELYQRELDRELKKFRLSGSEEASEE